MNPMFRRRNTVSSFSGMEKTSCPSISTFPEVGLSSAPTTFRRVLFPEPDSPTIAMNSPLPTEKFTWSRACTLASPFP